ncbi:hypothetical protein A2165_02535 [Candidatus Curtissbacteria bacterium RBG_13_40_7]|uniref:Phage holin family protein n=1 Tax=Candidatus Curtissbacteria bacterium RBG_13_40_7 TaxID=1797706 RepID=A0A1F5FY86_9BACT|nr:MAG: hypothetical protein A2165_02535 [Candidatus Curtissbacteria bacterium RBG_13_40_7]
MQFLINILVTAVIVFATAYLIPGFEVQSFWAAVVVALVLAVLNAFVKPILTILTLPITILTLGLFSLIISAIILLLTAWLVPGFSIEPYWMALPAAIVITVFSAIASKFK